MHSSGATTHKARAHVLSRLPLTAHAEMSLATMLAAPAPLASNAPRRLDTRAVLARARVPASPALAAREGGCHCRRTQRAAPVVAAAADKEPATAGESKEEEDGAWFEGLAPEEDAEVPGGYAEAMSASTRLGKAIRSACDELDALAALEDEALREADVLLGKLGVVKGSIFGAAGAAGAGEGPRDALAALKRAAEEEAQAQAAHERAMAARQSEGGSDCGNNNTNQ